MGDLDSANSIKDADDALSALQLGRKVKSNDQWESTKVTVVDQAIRDKIVESKLLKQHKLKPKLACLCVQVKTCENF